MSVNNCSEGRGYRVKKDFYIDEGKQVSEVVEGTFTPDFYNRDTIQVWDVSGSADINIRRWIGATLKENSLHEITIVNNSLIAKEVVFLPSYYLEDDVSYKADGKSFIVLGPNGSAHFYATAIFHKKNLELVMRIGSQDDRRV